MLFGLVVSEQFPHCHCRDMISRYLSLERKVRRLIYTPVTLPPIDKSFAGKLAHCGGAELCKNCKHNDFVQLDAEVHQISHRAFDPNLVWFFRSVVWQPMYKHGHIRKGSQEVRRTSILVK